MAIGTLGPLSRGEAEMAGSHNLGQRGVERAWEYWTVRLRKAEATWANSGLPMVTGNGTGPARRATPAARRSASRKAAARRKKR
jgi:hypothetical protein